MKLQLICCFFQQQIQNQYQKVQIFEFFSILNFNLNLQLVAFFQSLSSMHSNDFFQKSGIRNRWIGKES